MKNPETEERAFPVLMTYEERRAYSGQACPTSVPWSLLAPHEAQAKLNHHQDLETLASRGGLGPDELLAIIEDRKWSHMAMAEAVRQLRERLGRRSFLQECEAVYANVKREG